MEIRMCFSSTHGFLTHCYRAATLLTFCTQTIVNNGCCHVHGKTWVFYACAWYCNWQGQVETERCCQCTYMSICVLTTYSYVHMWYDCSDKHAERENNYSGWIKVRAQQWVEGRWDGAVISVCRFLWWMWQPLCYLMSLRHGWRIVGEWSFLCCWHRTAAHSGFDVCWQFVTLLLQWTLDGERGKKERSWTSRTRVLHSVALSVPLFVGSLKSHLCIEHTQIKADFTK